MARDKDKSFDLNWQVQGFSLPLAEPKKLLCKFIKDGAYYCYCAYVLLISRYSGFLWVVPTNTGTILRSLKLYGESKT